MLRRGDRQRGAIADVRHRGRTREGRTGLASASKGDAEHHLLDGSRRERVSVGEVLPRRQPHLTSPAAANARTAHADATAPAGQLALGVTPRAYPTGAPMHTTLHTTWGARRGRLGTPLSRFPREKNRSVPLRNACRHVDRVGVGGSCRSPRTNGLVDSSSNGCKAAARCKHIEVLVLKVALTGGKAMSDIREGQKVLVTRILEGGGEASRSQRRAAFDNAETSEPVRTLIQKVALRAHEVTDDDVAAARKSGLNEDQIFELVVCAAIGQATRQHDSALAALAAATGRDARAPRDSR